MLTLVLSCPFVHCAPPCFLRYRCRCFWGGISSPGIAFQPNAVERAAAAQVLSGERSRFKRVVSKRLGGGGDSTKTAKKKKRKKTDREQEEGGAQPLEGVDAAVEGAEGQERRAAAGLQEEQEQQQQQEEQQRQEPVLISVGGFKAVDHSVAVTREVADFCRVVAAVKRAAAAAAAGVAAGYGGMEEEGAGSALARAGLFEPAFLLILHSLEVRLFS